MTVLTALGAAFLFALACNLDTVLAAMSQGARGQPPGLSDAVLMAALTTAVTFLSLSLGAAGAALMPPLIAGQLGGLALTSLGLWYLLDALRGVDPTQSKPADSSLPLAAALAVNNAGIGLAAGITGLSPVLAAGCNFILTLLSLRMGQLLGRRLARRNRWALPLSGALLVVLGLWQLVRLK